MPTSYVQKSAVPIQRHLDQLLDLVGNDGNRRRALVGTYADELGDPAWGDYTLGQMRQEIADEPMRFFVLVSSLLCNPPRVLGLDDRRRIADGLCIELQPNRESLMVSDDGVWFRELLLGPADSIWKSERLRVNRYSYQLSTWSGTNEIVPITVYDFLKSSVACYGEGLLPVAVVLAAICFEACLREVLTGLECDRITRRPPYKPARARIDAFLADQDPSLSFDIKGACKDIGQHFSAMEPRGPKGALGTIRFSIIREDAPQRGLGTPSSQRLCLTIRAERQMADLLSSDQRETTGRRQRANNFSDLTEAAEGAGRLEARDLPLDSAETLRQVRNYLVHWDPSCLETVLGNGQTVREYIGSEETVRKTILDVGTFVSSEYYDLREYQMQRAVDKGC